MVTAFQRHSVRKLAVATLSAFAWLGVSAARAQLTIEHNASLLVFPRVLADATTETYIELANSSNSLVKAHCFYFGVTAGESALEEFDVALPKAASTNWVVSKGRPVDPNDPPCSLENVDCEGAGLDPGVVPPVADGFRGELVCVETDASDFAIAGNHLLGSATQVTRATGDVTRYAALGSVGSELAGGDAVLCLGESANPSCNAGLEYDPCPNRWIVDTRPDGAQLVDGTRSRTRLTIIPCSQDLTSGTVTPVTVQLLALTVLGTCFATQLQITAWTDVDVSAIDAGLGATMLGDAVAQLRLGTSDGHGVFILAGERREGVGPSAVAVQAQHIGGASAGDVILIPTPVVGAGNVGVQRSAAR